MNRLIGAAFAAALLAQTTTAAAADLKVYPVRVALSPKAPVATMMLHNSGAEPTLLQMRVFAWSQKDGQDILSPTQEVLANPGGFLIKPGADQIARFGLHAPASPIEKSYRVLIEEVPSRPPERAGEVITLLRVSVPVFVTSAEVKGRLEWRVRQGPEGRLDVEVRNDGGAHVQLAGLRLSRPDGEVVLDQKLSAYVLPGTSRRIALDGGAKVGPHETLQLEAATDQTTIHATVTTEAGADEMASR
jgi:fimbrial chaperone protein